METKLYWSREDGTHHHLCSFHGELRSLGRGRWVDLAGIHEGFGCEECREEAALEGKGLDAYIAFARRHEAWVVVGHDNRWAIEPERIGFDGAAQALRRTWVGWMAPTFELAEARMKELVAASDGARRYSVRRALDVLVEDFECELLALARDARVC